MSKGYLSGKGHKNDREESKVQKRARENKALKRQIASLRKSLHRIDDGWCPGCIQKDDSDKNFSPEEPSEQYVVPEADKKDRLCYQCRQENLQIAKYFKIGVAYYYRRCPNPGCGYRTKGKKFTPDVKE